MEQLIHKPDGSLESADPWTIESIGRRVRMTEEVRVNYSGNGRYGPEWIGMTGTIRKPRYANWKREGGFVYIHWDEDPMSEIRYVHQSCLEFID